MSATGSPPPAGTFDAWIAELDTRRLAEMGEEERTQVERFLERRGFTIGPEADCVFCGIPGAVLRNPNGDAGHWHCPPPGSPESLQRFRDLCNALRGHPDATGAASPAITTTTPGGPHEPAP